MLKGLFHEAFVSIAASPLRTFLAMLGIVIGVGSVVMMVAVGTGSQRAIEMSVAKLGTNMLIITPGSSFSAGLRNMDASELTVADTEALTQLSGVEKAAPATRARAFQVSYLDKNWSTQITGVSADFFTIRAWSFKEGETFPEQNSRAGARVAVLGSTTAKELFEEQSPVGRNIRINGLAFRVTGVLESKGQGFDGRDQDDAIFIPYYTAQRKLLGALQPDLVPTIFVQAVSREALEDATNEITELLRQRHKVKATEPDPFMIRNMTAITQTATETAGALSLLLGAIASISLVVGGIGIMNIMLVTVTERTREIGIRKAIGATQANILTQFLLESVIISAIGSGIGLVIGAACAMAAGKWGNIPAQVDGWSVILSLSVAVGVGVLSGLYPARRAARLQPVEALRMVGA